MNKNIEVAAEVMNIIPESAIDRIGRRSRITWLKYNINMLACSGKDDYECMTGEEAVEEAFENIVNYLRWDIKKYDNSSKKINKLAYNIWAWQDSDYQYKDALDSIYYESVVESSEFEGSFSLMGHDFAERIKNYSDHKLTAEEIKERIIALRENKISELMEILDECNKYFSINHDAIIQKYEECMDKWLDYSLDMKNKRDEERKSQKEFENRYNLY